MDIYVTEKGALGDGVTDDSRAIQSAIDEVSAAGGGRVIIPAGRTFLSSSLTLRGGVCLHLEDGSVLRASGDIDTYYRPNEKINDEAAKKYGNPVTGKPSFVFIHALGEENISITGRGAVDGNCYAFVRRKDRFYVTGDFYPRPTMIYLENCRHVTVSEVTLKDAPFWTLHPAGCYDVSVDRVRILNPLDVANSDGIDPDHCEFVRITNCHIECADDCICLKNTAGNAEYGPCRNVVISGCTLISTSAAIKIGTEGVDDFENIIVSSCVISRSNRGLSIQIRDAGRVRDVVFSDIFIETRRFCEDWWGCAEPVALTCIPRAKGGKAGTISAVTFRNVTARGENGVLIYAENEGDIRDVRFVDCRVALRQVTFWPKDEYDLRPGEGTSVIKRKTKPVFMRGERDIRFENCIFEE